MAQRKVVWACMGKLSRRDDHKICGKLLINETVETPVKSPCVAFAYRISCEMYTPYAGEDGILLHRQRKLNGEIEITPFIIKLSRYELSFCH
jgi:hypothetical protein